MGKTGRFVESMFKVGMVTVYLPRAGDLIYAIYWFYGFKDREKLEMQRVRGQMGKYLLQMGTRCITWTARRARGCTVEWALVGEELCSFGGGLVVKLHADVSTNAQLEINKKPLFSQFFTKFGPFLVFAAFL